MLALDHIIISGKNAEEVSATYGEQFSIKAVRGGEHADWGTYNYLAYFSNDSYIEWLGVNDLQQASSAENPLIQHLVYTLEQEVSPIPFQMALRTNQMEQYIQHFKKENIPFTGPFHGERKKPDGTILKWRMLFPSFDFRIESLPFLIEWEQPLNPAGLQNPQAITSVTYSGTTKERFTHIFQLHARLRNKNYIRLHNTKIRFTEKGPLSFKLE